jgi:hypothetical protein
MTLIPDVTTTIKDGALGLTGATPEQVHAVIGMCTSGTPNTLYQFVDKGALVDELVGGPAVEAAAHSLDVAGGPIIVVPIDGSVAGVVGDIEKDGSSQTDVGTTGDPTDAFELAVLITLGGARGTARFKYALDYHNPNGPTWSDEIVTAATYALPDLTGLTLTFANVTYVVDDVYAGDCTAPGYTAGDLEDALQALIDDPREWGFVHIVGQASSVTNSAGIAAQAKSQIEAAATSFRYAFAVVECADDTDSNIAGNASFLSFSSTRVGVCAGFEEFKSAINGRVQKRSIAFDYCARLSAISISTDPAEIDPPLSGAVELLRDEQTSQVLDPKRFTTARTIVGLTGFFITNGRMMAPSGSDFKYVQHRRVMDRACSIARPALLRYLSKGVLTNDDGTIDEAEAVRIESNINAALDQQLMAKGHVQSISILVDRTNNIISTETLKVKVRLRPKGYLKFIELEIGFQSPKAKAALPHGSHPIPPRQRHPAGLEQHLGRPRGRRRARHHGDQLQLDARRPARLRRPPAAARRHPRAVQARGEHRDAARRVLPADRAAREGLRPQALHDHRLLRGARHAPRHRQDLRLPHQEAVPRQRPGQRRAGQEDRPHAPLHHRERMVAHPQAARHQLS